MEYADLHIHSIYSDGKLSVKSIIKYASELHLKTISITDHDTIEGLKEPIISQSHLSLEIVPGVEFSTVYKGQEIHILGYYFDINNEKLNQLLGILQHSRRQRAMEIAKKLKHVGIPIMEEDLDQVNHGYSVGRPHIAQIIVNKGFALDYNDAFHKYLLPGTQGYVPRYKLASKDAIEVIKGAGGISVLAHPGLIKDQSLIQEILTLDIDGIEVYHTKHTSQHVRHYYCLSKENDLLITGGSDCHGNKPFQKPFIGSTKIPNVYVDQLKIRNREI
ncbi:MAG: PHP domain-containing protein [Eubacteriales bacterium]